MIVFDTINKMVSIIIKYILILLSIVMIVSLSIQVIGRYVFNTGFAWTEEIGRYAMIWLVFLGISYIALNSEHINVSLFQDSLKGLPKKILLILQDLLSLAFSGIILSYSFDALKIASMSVSANTGLSMGIIYAVFPISMILTIYAYVYRIVIKIAKGNETYERGEK